MPLARTRTVPSGFAQRQPTPLRTPRRSLVRVFGATHRTSGLHAGMRARPNSPVSPSLYVQANPHARTLTRQPMVIWRDLTSSEFPVHTTAEVRDQVECNTSETHYYERNSSE